MLSFKSIHIATCMNSHKTHESLRPKIKLTWNPSWTCLACQSRSCKAIHDHVCMSLTNTDMHACMHDRVWAPLQASKTVTDLFVIWDTRYTQQCCWRLVFSDVTVCQWIDSSWCIQGSLCLLMVKQKKKRRQEEREYNIDMGG
jgi:hypothetical protein